MTSASATLDTRAPLLAARGVFLQLVFAWRTRDGDVHAKNLSVLQQPSGEWRLAPIYDVPSTLFYGDTSMALTMGGRRDGLIRKHLVAFGQELGLPAKAAESAMQKALKTTERVVSDLEAGALPYDPTTTRRVLRQLNRRRKDASR